MLDLAFNTIQSFVFNIALLAASVGGLITFLGVWYLNFTKRLPAMAAIPMAAVCLAVSASIFSWSTATDRAKFACKLLESEARADGEKAANEALKQVMAERQRRLLLATLAEKKSSEQAARLRDELNKAQENRIASESMIHELEKSLPNNPNCTTGASLRRELSD